MSAVDELRAAIEHLASFDRASCSPGEREAADWIAGAFAERGAHARVEPARAHGTYWWPLGITSAAGILAAVAARRGHRLAGALLGVAACGVAVDDLSAGRRWLRRLLPQHETANVVAVAGDPDASETLVLVAHHDAAHTGAFFDPRLTEKVGEILQHTGDPIETPPRQLPLMAPIAVTPAVAGLAGLLGARRLATLAAGVCAGIIASLVEMASRRTVPGANDNLTGVATLLGVARQLQERPLPGLRVVLVSTGAEEALMVGMHAFARWHFRELSAERTRVLCIDTVGSPYLVLAEAEGMVRVRDYDAELKDLLSACAEEEGIRLGRGMRMRLGTDGYLALRHGLPAALLMSVDRHGSSSNYHWHTDTPDRVDYGRLQEAVTLCDRFVRRVAATVTSASASTSPAGTSPTATTDGGAAPTS